MGRVNYIQAINPVINRQCLFAWCKLYDLSQVLVINVPTPGVLSAMTWGKVLGW